MCAVEDEYREHLKRQAFKLRNPGEEGLRLLLTLEEAGIDPLCYDMIVRLRDDFVGFEPAELEEMYNQLNPDLQRAYTYWRTHHAHAD